MMKNLLQGAIAKSGQKTRSRHDNDNSTPSSNQLQKAEYVFGPLYEVSFVSVLTMVLSAY